MPRETPKGKSLAEVKPNLAKEWHPTKNNSEYDIAIPVSKKVWWKCKNGDDHEWESTISSRLRGRNCPVCAGKKIVKSNCLSTLYPELVKEWDIEKNLPLKPGDVGAGSGKKVWWKCPKGHDHEWETPICDRVSGRGCPICSGHKVVRSNSLGVLKPKAAELWNKSRNGGLSPFAISPYSNKKFWWKCPKGDDHEFERSPAQWKENSDCPVCSGRKVVKSNCLATTHPEISSQWHTAKNGELNPDKVVAGSNKRVWWKCPQGEDHEWQSRIQNRTLKNSGCPICSGHITVKSNSLQVLNPELAKEWHPNKNGKKRPVDVHVNSHYNAWWKCKTNDEHVWQTKVLSRNHKGTGCPFCANLKIDKSNSLLSLFPEIAADWHPVKNGTITPDNVGAGSGKKVWWKCSKGDDHEWKTSIGKRTSGKGCPFCAGQKVSKTNSFKSQYPELLSFWSYDLNSISPDELTSGSNKMVWWKCENNDEHTWQATVNALKRGRRCPYCTGKRVNSTNSLAAARPDIASEWHPLKNGKITPQEVTLGSGKLVWWKCPQGEDHEWKASIDNRVSKKSGCPVCSNKLIVESNCLQTLNPVLASEWHPKKNGTLNPKNVGAGSELKVWWKCPKGQDHEWPATIINRNRGKGCPFCTLTPQSRQELTISFELALFFKINPKGFKTRKTGRLWTIDIYLEELNLGIEFDGKYWHKDKRDLDKIKTKKLTDAGFQIMRIREEPLKAITPIDVVSALPFNAKKVTNEILRHILEAYKLKPKQVELIEGYLRKRTLQNEEGLNEYIDMILEEKANKKRSKKK